MLKTKIIKYLHYSPRLYSFLKSSVENTNHLIAKTLINQIKSMGIVDNIQVTEFKVYSQFGDDGIIQYLINNIELGDREKVFVEMGVEDYTESNTRFLLVNNNWRGMVVDANEDDIAYIKRDSIYWKNDIQAVVSFITKNNVNEILQDNDFAGKLGLLSIDIDGNDYWILDAMKVVDPVIIVAEYNGLFGSNKAVTVPYKKDFSRMKEHYSGLYWGCSLKALYLLMKKKGYEFIGTNSAGNNSYFVKSNRLGKLKKVSLREGFTEPKYRESRNRKGNLTYLSGHEKLKEIEGCLLFDIEKSTEAKVGKIFDL